MNREGFAVGRRQRRSYIETGHQSKVKTAVVALAGRVYCIVAMIFCRYYDRSYLKMYIIKV